MRRRFAAMSIAVLCCAPMFAGAAENTEPAAKVNTQVVTFSEHEHVWDVAVSPDGEHLYYQVSYPVVNVWAVIVYYWPELLWIPCGLISLIVIWRAIRRWRGRRQVGEPYCKRCNYRLTGSTEAEECPECGAALQPKGVVVAKPVTSLALLLWVFAIMIPPLVPAVVLLRDPPRSGAVGEWFDWNSQALAEHAIDEAWESVKNKIIGAHEVREVSIATVDAATDVKGHHTRSEHPKLAYANVRIAVDNQRRVVAWQAFNVAHSTVVVQPARIDENVITRDMQDVCMANMMNPSPLLLQSDTAHYVDEFNNVVAVDIESLELIESKVDVIRQNRAPTNPDEPPYTQVWDVEDGRRRLHVFGDRYFDSTALVVGKDGRFLYAAMGEGVLEKWDLEAKQLVGEIGRREGQLFFQIARSPDGGTLYVAASKDTGLREDIEVHTFDVATGEWGDTFDAGGVVDPYRFIATGDGQRLVLFGKDANGHWRIVVITPAASRDQRSNAGIRD